MRRSIVAGVASAVLIACGFLIAIALATRSTTGRRPASHATGRVPAGRATARVPASRAMPHGLAKFDHIVFIIASLPVRLTRRSLLGTCTSLPQPNRSSSRRRLCASGHIIRDQCGLVATLVNAYGRPARWRLVGLS
jgi:hypothetical protein